MWIIVAVCAALLTPFAAVFMVEMEESGRVWYPGLLAFIGVLGFCPFALSMGLVNIWDTAVK
ncbi:MAG: hypothetical protein J6K25_04680 [Thermoguttaceae bacterium]|nr:hypothetical protein [Thermoguttaceae bacterium]